MPDTVDGTKTSNDVCAKAGAGADTWAGVVTIGAVPLCITASSSVLRCSVKGLGRSLTPGRCQEPPYTFNPSHNCKSEMKKPNEKQNMNKCKIYSVFTHVPHSCNFGHPRTAPFST